MRLPPPRFVLLPLPLIAVGWLLYFWCSSALTKPMTCHGERRSEPAEKSRGGAVKMEAFRIIRQDTGLKAAVRSIDMKGIEELLLDWTKKESRTPMQAYFDTHISRLARTIQLIPPGTNDDIVLEMGCYMQVTPLLTSLRGYGSVRGCDYGSLGTIPQRRSVVSKHGVFQVDVDLFNAEKDIFPYADNQFSMILCSELLEHLALDPMHLLSQLNRITKTGGHLLITTPNTVSFQSIAAVLTGYHPSIYPVFPSPGVRDPRHAREYTPREVKMLFESAGFEVERLETSEYGRAPPHDLKWVEEVLRSSKQSLDLRDPCILCLGRKVGPVKERYPKYMYS